MTSVRRARPDDLPGLLELYRQMHGESYYAAVELDAERVGVVTMHAITQAAFFAAVAEDEQGIFGVLIGSLGELDFTAQLIAQERVLYIAARRRGTLTGARAALDLLSEFLAWGAAHEVLEVRAGISAGVDDEAALAFYRRVGFDLHHPIYRLSRGPHVRH
jgi:hypothetical protein